MKVVLISTEASQRVTYKTNVKRQQVKICVVSYTLFTKDQQSHRGMAHDRFKLLLPVATSYAAVKTPTSY